MQGVSYRAGAVDQAQRLGLVGWVRNLYTGEVEALAEGPRDKLDAFVAWCRRGPDEADVSKVVAEWGAATGEFPSFGVRR